MPIEFNPRLHVARASLDDYNHEPETRESSIYLKLTQGEQRSLLVALRAQLEAYGVKMCHENIIAAEGPHADFHPDSHIGKLVKLFQRIDAAIHGRKTWNAAWRKKQPYSNLEHASRGIKRHKTTIKEP